MRRALSLQFSVAGQTLVEVHVYATCLFCHHRLGRNEAIEHFPVGRRLAWDAGKGRLWVVCRRCERWNLTPLEERWEAIEEAERAFRATRQRIATDNIALARLREGLELVRIGAPPRLELATWRYGRQFRRRRVAAALGFSAAPVMGVGAMLWTPASPLVLAATGVSVCMIGAAEWLQNGSRPPPQVPDGTGGVLRLAWYDVRRASLTRVPEVRDWCLTVRQDGCAPDDELDLFDEPEPLLLRRTTRLTRWLDGLFPPPRSLTFRGDQATRVLASMLPWANSAGASARQLGEAVDVLERSATAHQLVYGAAGEERAAGSGTPLGRLAKPLRLALEMALHEDDERRAMEGELAALEARWREAEEIAAIADALAFPREAAMRLETLRRRRRAVSGSAAARPATD